MRRSPSSKPRPTDYESVPPGLLVPVLSDSVCASQDSDGIGCTSRRIRRLREPDRAVGVGSDRSFTDLHAAPAATTNCRPAGTRAPIAPLCLWEDDEVDGGAVETLPHAQEADYVCTKHHHPGAALVC